MLQEAAISKIRSEQIRGRAISGWPFPHPADELTASTADGNANYRVALQAGAFVLDAQDRAAKLVRAKPQPFAVVSSQTVHVEIDLDTDIR